MQLISAESKKESYRVGPTMNAWAVALYRLGGPLELILLFEWYRADTQHPHGWCRVFVVFAPVRH